MNLLRLVSASLVLLSVGLVSAQDATPEATIQAGMLPERIVVKHEGLFPEGIEYDSVNRRFLVSSVAEGTVYAVSDDGTTTPFIQDERIPSSTELEVDRRVIVCWWSPLTCSTRASSASTT